MFSSSVRGSRNMGCGRWFAPPCRDRGRKAGQKAWEDKKRKGRKAGKRTLRWNIKWLVSISHQDESLLPKGISFSKRRRLISWFRAQVVKVEGIGLKSLAWPDASHKTLEKVLNLKNGNRNRILLKRFHKTTIHSLVTSFGGNVCIPG